MQFMLDTNICIYVIKKKPRKVLERFKASHVNDICLSSITLSELEYWVAKNSKPQQNQQALSQFLTPLEILPYDDRAAVHYGEIRFFLEKKGKTIGAMDLLIAAHARSLGLTLITNNTREFRRIPHLKVENWT